MSIETVLRGAAAAVNDFEAGRPVPAFDPGDFGRRRPWPLWWVGGAAAAAAVIVIGLVLFGELRSSPDGEGVAASGAEAAEGFRPLAPGATWIYDVTLNGVLDAILELRIDTVVEDGGMTSADIAGLVHPPGAASEQSQVSGTWRVTQFEDGTSTLNLAPFVADSLCKQAEPLVIPPVGGASPGEAFSGALSLDCGEETLQLQADGEILGMETVDTPLGSFDAARLELSLTGDLSAQLTYFFAEGTGLVVLEVDDAKGLRRFELAEIQGFETDDRTGKEGE